MGTDLPPPEGTPIGIQAFKKLDLSTANSSIVPLVVATPETIYCVGTAFCISSIGLWVTARHVLEGRGGAIELQKQNKGSHLAILWVGSGAGQDVPSLIGGTVPVSAFARHPASGSDLAILKTKRSSFNFPALTLSAALPVVGTPIVGAGYPQIDIKSTGGNGQRRNLNITPNLHTSSGRVLQLYKDGRDKFKDLDGNFTGKLPTVCFETSARFDSGMSGGPVLDHKNTVCGVISTGLEQSLGGAHDTSFVSGTPYIFMLNVRYGKGSEKTTTVYELAERGYVPTDESFERLRMTDDGKDVHLYYDAPGQPRQQ
ncbi:trypsin-like peptidase domain-containing protein [Mycobacterium sp. CBMA293]|uniref:S1 family peptidase n=1 Tax=unclassified Mycolicibacterium TaxID=2636767 RepID=UPI0012DC9E96|nr:MULTISPECIES: serine protease [unclassified Mycolicibacterium]MUL45664.1 trypsin-like peptidase domain-containing protein [Mycolicibacterium sp. CBMA 360]MUL60334.1 trypsin-like peptidase domain-containing protein [Mycolicibacterium sp. CBMA 335]MUL71454.1 trypsin-like peptidase domain-containing protein [Mycolicibacterium sp. CBMA 311]MUL73121.1 trypsin-like peptidase domain-containing protein [Mycolicibacterium sp. CBMA 311]MUL97070.1 trypsin-like peptidase domain-containing protein [Myco